MKKDIKVKNILCKKKCKEKQIFIKKGVKENLVHEFWFKRLGVQNTMLDKQAKNMCTGANQSQTVPNGIKWAQL